MAEPRKTGRRTSARAKVNVPEEDAYGHVQPQALEFEEAVLGALMIEQDAYSQVSEILRPESFYDHRHQLIYEAIRTLNLQQKPVDILTVTEHLNTMGKLEEVGGPFYITQLSGKVASSAHIEYHARIIAQKFLARELITFTSLVQTKAFDATVDVDDLMQEAEGKLFEISQQNMKKDYTQGGGAQRRIERVEQRLRKVGQDDFRLAKLRFGHHCSPSGHGKDGFRALHGQEDGGGHEDSGSHVLVGNEQRAVGQPYDCQRVRDSGREIEKRTVGALRMVAVG